MEHFIRQTRRAMTRLDLGIEPAHVPSAIAYFNYYGIHFEDVRHFFGTFRSGTHNLAAHLFLPGHTRGTVFLLHGYLDHSGILRHLIRQCLDQGFAVAVHDLPGHGLSTGERAAIGDFSEYASALNELVRLCKPHLPMPYHLVGHSTGGSILLEHMFRSREHSVFEKRILLAPLVRFSHWRLSGWAHLMIKPFVKTVPRRIPQNSSDPDFVTFLKNDPLRCRHVAIRWLDALYAWNKRMAAYSPRRGPVLIIQGEADRVVDWKYNLPFLETKITGSRVKLIANTRHQLLNESDPMRSEVLGHISAYIESV